MFRKVTAMLVALVLCCTSLGACGKENAVLMEDFLDAGIPLEREYRGVSFSVEDATSKGAFIRYENRNDVPVLYGAGWKLFVKTNDGYRWVGFKKNLVFPAALFDEPYVGYRDFTWFYSRKGLGPGSYRIVYYLVFSGVNTEPLEQHQYQSNTVYLYADFEISIEASCWID